jgi:GT2 family glycosyltransferase
MITNDTAASVSVIIGAYNAEDWIRETLDSVLSQTRPVLEVLVVDDGSSDRTPQIVESYGGNVKCMREQHRGRPHRNRGIAASKGEYIAFIDADDYWQPRKLQLQMALLASRRLAWAICEVQWSTSALPQARNSPNPPIPDGEVLERLFLNNFIASATPVIAKYVFDTVGYFNETLEVRVVEDWDLWLRIAARFPLGCVREPLATIRLHAGSFLATTPLAERVQSLEAVVARAVDREPDRLKRLERLALANIYYSAGVQAIRAGRFQEARGYFTRELKRRPAHAEAVAYLVFSALGPTLANRIIQFKRYLWKVMGQLRQY